MYTTIASQMSADGMTVGEIQRHGNMAYNNLSLNQRKKDQEKAKKNGSETRNKSISWESEEKNHCKRKRRYILTIHKTF